MCFSFMLRLFEHELERYILYVPSCLAVYLASGSACLKIKFRKTFRVTDPEELSHRIYIHLHCVTLRMHVCCSAFNQIKNPLALIGNFAFAIKVGHGYMHASIRTCICAAVPLHLWPPIAKVCMCVNARSTSEGFSRPALEF